MSILVVLVVIVLSLVSIFAPIFGLSGYYFTSILQPHTVWDWYPDHLRLNLILGLACLLGFFLNVANRETVKIHSAFSFQSFMMATMLFIIHVSEIFSPYRDFVIPPKMIPPDVILGDLNIMFVFYFVFVALVNNEKRLVALAYVLAATGLVLVYWSNSTYSYYGWAILNWEGRMAGPANQDENIFAARIVSITPLLFYIGVLQQKKMYRYFFWVWALLAWHSVFLTGSRGGLLSLAIVILITLWSYRSKKLGLIVLGGFLVALVWQSPALIERVTKTIEQGQELVDDGPVDPRILSWAAGIEMVLDKPILGVGAGRFQQASMDYGADIPYVAHNTFLQLSANSGLFAGCIYLLLLYLSVRDIPKVRRYIGRREGGGIERIEPAIAIYLASANGLVGFYICSIFLDLIVYELFYILIGINFCARLIMRERLVATPVSRVNGTQ